MALIVSNQVPASVPAVSPRVDIRDLKPPVEIPSGSEWLWVLAALATAALLIWLFMRWLKKRKAQAAIIPFVPAHVRARQRLREALPLIKQPKPFVIAVSDAARAYLEERFNFHAPERTTEEFLRELSATELLVQPQKESLGRFLEGCDLVKFAKYEPGEPELRELYASATRLVDETAPQALPNSELRTPDSK